MAQEIEAEHKSRRYNSVKNQNHEKKKKEQSTERKKNEKKKVEMSKAQNLKGKKRQKCKLFTAYQTT